MNIRIEHNKPALRIITQPFLVGDELEREALLASQEFLSAHPVDHPVEVVILEGARYYHLAEAYEALYEKSVHKCMLNCKRYFDQEWDAKISYCDLDGLCTGTTILLGDTIATGITLDNVLRRLLEHHTRNNLDTERIEIFTIAGARSVEAKLAPVDALLTAAGIELTITFANAGFELAENGTDLLFDNAEYHPKAKAALDDLLGPFLSEMGCAIWDWGDRFRAPQAHLERIAEHYLADERATPDYIRTGIIDRLSKD